VPFQSKLQKAISYHLSSYGGKKMKGKVSICVFLFIFLIFGSGWAAEFHVKTPAEFQEALTAAQENGEDDIIYLAEGTYYGGFSYDVPLTEEYDLTITAQPGSQAGNVILDGENSQTVLVVYCDYQPEADFVVDGLTLQNGSQSRNAGGLFVHTRGNVTLSNNMITGNTGGAGGIWVSGGKTVTLTNNTISNNSSGTCGGVHFTGGKGTTFTLTNNTINDNNGGTWGGGVWGSALANTTVTLSNNTIRNNNGRFGGLMLNGGTTVTLSNNAISNNNADWGGGVYVTNGITVTVSNNTISNNSAQWGGGVFVTIYDSSATITLTNNTISNNTASTEEKGGGICLRLFDHNVIAYIYNNIIWDNENGGDIYLEGSGTFNGFNNDYHELSGNWTHEGDNIDDDPLFVDLENHDYHLQTGSPCIDTGNNDAPELPEKDKDEKPRIIDGDGNGEATVDMGAYEFGDICEGDFNGDTDVDGSDLAYFVSHSTGVTVHDFAEDFGRTGCPGCE
jgi:hypothetical protein